MRTHSARPLLPRPFPSSVRARLTEMAKVYIKTYGCQMNARDSEQVARMLMERGHMITPHENEADVVLFPDLPT